jgi:hypothetical protein
MTRLNVLLALLLYMTILDLLDFGGCLIYIIYMLNLCRVYFYAERLTLGKHRRYREQDFAECHTRQRLLYRVPDKKHSTKRRALGKDPDSGSDL